MAKNMPKAVKKIVFLGANRYQEDGPLIDFIMVCKQLDIEVSLLFDPARSAYPTATLGKFEDAIKSLSIDYKVIERLSVSDIAEYAKEGAYAICVNCHWIVSPEIIALFDGRIFNYHNAALPEQRGAGCHSWRLMQGSSFSRMTFHEVYPAVDEGGVVIEKDISYPVYCRNLSESYAYVAPYEAEFFNDFLNSTKAPRKQSLAPSFYWPRLNTEVNGFIDWSWSAGQIQQFCAAFDKPFRGASSFLGPKKVRLREVSVDDTDTYFHPYQSGLIYRVEAGIVWVASNGGGLKVEKLLFEGEGKLRAGLRIATPPELLYMARIGKSA